MRPHAMHAVLPIKPTRQSLLFCACRVPRVRYMGIPYRKCPYTWRGRCTGLHAEAWGASMPDKQPTRHMPKAVPHYLTSAVATQHRGP